MTIGTLTLFAITGGLVLFKLALMALAVALLARTLLPEGKPVATRPALASVPQRNNPPR